MDMKTICNRMFLKPFMYTVYLTFNDKCLKNVTNEHNNNGVRGQIQYLFKVAH